MIHQPAGSFSEVATGEFILEVGELLKLRETLTRVYVQRTGKPLWVVSEDMERDVFMSATEAQAYGIVDLVAVELVVKDLLLDNSWVEPKNVNYTS
ncbi:hypothetical protein E3N88_11637 [Mikania micrantha]|uniref:ATP-dependent Clp protease proteolytic subunit n=1 Tax=Mikania micrantha TaxID=192012 RepID=A0A5N6PH30_9ASTR|nr:hypothetical protein E3N88_24737 [Mikania micrantha]KAD6120366.1 hypothetical protein E3N88_11637 [Mikania micrantha]